MSKLFGENQSPYYIWAPRWVESSAGIRALHYLCHSLNRAGQKSFLVMTEPRHHGEPRINPNLLTPELTQEVVDAHFRSGQTPIVIYSETTPGNPLGASVVVRFLMNFAGALGGPKKFDSGEMLFSFSKNISDEYFKNNKVKSSVLFVPPIDPSEFKFESEKKPYQVVYAGKYRAFIGAPPKVGSLPSIEIYRDGPRRQSRDQLKKLIAEASIVYSFENSSIVTEAILSGTPAGFVPNKFLGQIIAEHELGWAGTFLLDSEHDIASAQMSVRRGLKKYHAVVLAFEAKLGNFIQETQFRATSSGYNQIVSLPNSDKVVSTNRVRIAFQILRTHGPIVLFKEFTKYVKANF